MKIEVHKRKDKLFCDIETLATVKPLEGKRKSGITLALKLIHDYKIYVINDENGWLYKTKNGVQEFETSDFFEVNEFSLGRPVGFPRGIEMLAFYAITGVLSWYFTPILLGELEYSELFLLYVVVLAAFFSFVMAPVWIFAIEPLLFPAKSILISKINKYHFVNKKGRRIKQEISDANNLFISYKDAQKYLKNVKGIEYISSQQRLNNADNSECEYLNKEHAFYPPLITVAIDIWERMFINSNGSEISNKKDYAEALVRELYPGLKGDNAPRNIAYVATAFLGRKEKSNISLKK